MIMNLHPQVIKKEGRKEFVVLPYEEFVKLQEALEDYEDLRDLRNAKAESAGEETISLDEAKRMVSEDPEAYPPDKSGADNDQ